MHSYGRYGPLLSGWRSEREGRGWAEKRVEFSRAFFERVVLAHLPPPSGRRPRASYWALAALRVALALAPPTGYLHPDEFFQTFDPVAGSALDVEWSHSWEFNSTFPLRNMLLPHLSIGIPLSLLKFANHLLKDYLHVNLVTPYFVLVIPRLFYCLLSFINDYSLLRICLIHGEEFDTRLMFLATSHVVLVYACHTFTNSLEIVLLSILLTIVSECMLASKCIIHHNESLSKKYENASNIVERVKIFKLQKLLPEYSLRKCLQIATITTIGVFNRPTFIAFAFPSVFLWLLRGLGTKYVGFTQFHLRLFVFILSSLPSLLILILVDSFYYGHLTISDIESQEVSIENFVVTPLNFLRYNLFSDNLKTHGLHPRWLHTLVNIPMLFNVLALIGYFLLLKLAFRLLTGNFRTLPRIQSLHGLMTLSIIIPIILLSIFPHQEPRFLIPLLVPVIFLCTAQIQVLNNTKRHKKTLRLLFIIWCICNAVFVMFFGFLHQGGMYQAANHIHNEMNNKHKFVTVHIFTSHMYNIPQSLFLTEDTSKFRFNYKTRQKYKLSKRLFLYEFGSKPLSTVVKHIKSVWDVSETKMKMDRQPFIIYLLIPNSLRYQLGNDWGAVNKNYNLTINQENCFYPHLSTEAFPYFPPDDDSSCSPNFDFSDDISWNVKLTYMQQLKCYNSQFSLCMYQISEYSQYMQ